MSSLDRVPVDHATGRAQVNPIGGRSDISYHHWLWSESFSFRSQDRPIRTRSKIEGPKSSKQTSACPKIPSQVSGTRVHLATTGSSLLSSHCSRALAASSRVQK